MNDWALVTGAALRVGRECALTLGEAGYDILLHFRHSQKAVEEVKNTLQTQGVAADCIQGDFQNPEEVNALLSALADYPLKVVVNNAAVFIPDTAVTLNESVLRRQLQINYQTPFEIMSWVEKNRQGVTVINLLDGRLERSLGDFYSYGLSKTMTEWATRAFAAQTKANRYYGIAPMALLPPVVNEELASAEKVYRFSGTAVLKPVLKEMIEGRLPNGTIVSV